MIIRRRISMQNTVMKKQYLISETLLSNGRLNIRVNYWTCGTEHPNNKNYTKFHR